MSKWLQIVSAGSMMFAWFARASMDGKITTSELTELLTAIIEIFEVEVTLPEELTKVVIAK